MKRERRIDDLKKYIKSSNLDGMLISKQENYNYFSGFTGSFAYLFITYEKLQLYTDFRYMEQAVEQTLNFEVVECRGVFKKFFNERLKKYGIKKIGFEGNDFTYSKYKEFNDELEDIEVVSVGEDIDKLRLIKDSEEIEIIQTAVDIADDAFKHILSYIKPGVKEIDIAAEIEYFMKKRGASGPSFETIVASGKRASLPHGIATQKKIEQGDVITIDFGALYNGYCSDMTRTVFLGKPSKTLEKIYDIVLKAQIEAINYIKSGLTGVDVDLCARRVINQEGYEKNFGHGLGHGVGLEIHEEPRLSPSGNYQLEKNMVATIEPGIYIENLGGVRIEDIVVVENNKSKILTKSTKEKIVL